jgi:hypothetical protein
VQQDPAAVEHAGQTGSRRLGEPRQHVVDDGVRFGRRGSAARERERVADLFLDGRRAEKDNEPRNARFVEDAMDRR